MTSTKIEEVAGQRKLIFIKPSTNKDKKLMAKFELNNGKNKTVHFGAKGYMDFTLYSKNNKQKAEEKKANYIKRHKVNEDWNDPSSPGALSRFILWNLPTVEASIKDFKNRFKL